MTLPVHVLHRPLPAADPARPLGADAVVRCGSASAAVWWSQVPSVSGERPGLIGLFSATVEVEAANVLMHASELLRTQGCTVAIGPMDGSTWRNYRFVIWRGDAARFALEPEQPEAWPSWWQEAGFTIRDEYTSALVERLDGQDPRLASAWQRMQRLGVTIRPLEMRDFEGELEKIFAVCAIAFRDNVLYTPLPREEFLNMYRQIRPVVRGELCVIAEHDGRAVGFCFAIPDGEQVQRSVTLDTVVIKTLAVLPGRTYAGLGKVLLERTQQAAHAMGLRRAIHALMHAGNASRNLGDGAREIRRYGLLSRRLA